MGSKPTKSDAMRALAKLGIKSDKQAREMGFSSMEGVIDEIGKNYKSEGRYDSRRSVKISPSLR